MNIISTWLRKRRNKALFEAINANDPINVMKMIKDGAEVNAEYYVISPLWMATQDSQYFNIVKILIAHGANLNYIADSRAEHSNGYACLHNACIKGGLDIVHALLNNGADCNIRDLYGNTPLIHAIESWLYDIGIVTLLLSFNADIHAQNYIGKTALFAASSWGRLDAVNLLLEKEANPNITLTTNGLTPLMAAACSGHCEVIQALLHKGADITIEDHNGTTALGHANFHGYKRVIEVLK